MWNSRTLYDEDGEDNDGDIVEAGYSTVGRNRKRGRKKRTQASHIEALNAPTLTPPVDIAYRRVAGEEGFNLPNYPGDPTEQEVVENMRALPDARTGSKSQNDYLREWLPKRPLYLSKILESEAFNIGSGACQGCLNNMGSWRCRHCVGGRIFCGGCLRKRHQFLPFHRVEKWTGRFFRVGALWEVGLRLYLGHGGQPCPGRTTLGANNEADLYIANETGDYSGRGVTDIEGYDEGPTPALSSEDSLMATMVGDPEVPLADHAEDGDDDDVWIYDDSEVQHSDLPKAKRVDNDGHPFVSVVDITGIHEIPVVYCTCGQNSDSDDMMYLEMGLFPTSFERIQTVFTLQVLNDFRISNLECKTSAYQYYQKLRRLTSSAFPKGVLNRYRELRRLSRQYRNLKLWKIHGKGHDPDVFRQGGIYTTFLADFNATADPTEQGGARADDVPIGAQPSPPQCSSEDVDTRGTLCIFCPACPQPGVNLPDDWDPDDDVHMRGEVADGNFKADHLCPTNEADDVQLTAGEAFMTASAPYQKHMKEAEELAHKYKRIPTCHNYHATAAENKPGIGKRVRGIGAHACARHGCFCPSSVVDFAKGEKQMHMDWSLTQSRETTNTNGIKKFMEIYDINCQYCVHLEQRIKDSTTMDWPESLRFVHAIGLFHVHGHKEECLNNFATTYIPGAAIVDREILETLWSVLNEISRSTRSATIAHRTEVLDDHMGDSNWKKTINMADTIKKKFERAVKESENAVAYYKQITDVSPQELLPTWEQEIVAAEVARFGGDLDAMNQTMKSKIPKAPGLREIELVLSERELLDPGHTGKAAWISTGLKLEEAQMELRAHVRSLGRRPNTTQKLDLVNKRRAVRTRIESFHRLAGSFLGEAALDHIEGSEQVVLDDEVEPDQEPDHGNKSITRADPERELLPFPSTIDPAYILKLDATSRQNLNDIISMEAKLRIGHAEDTLEDIRTALIQLSWQKENVLRDAEGVKQVTRAWDGFNRLAGYWKLKRQVYNANRKHMSAILLRDGEIVQAEHSYPVLELGDCKVSMAVANPNSAGQSSERISWIWRSRDNRGSSSNREHSDEFYRINWLRARAHRNRWNEELRLTSYEMQWTVRFYMYMARTWRRRADAVPTTLRGHRAYGERQIAMWNELGSTAEKVFEKTNEDYNKVWTLVG